MAAKLAHAETGEDVRAALVLACSDEADFVRVQALLSATQHTGLPEDVRARLLADGLADESPRVRHALANR